jgi:hypothetical protein
MNIFRFALTAILASASVTYVASNPNGAGGCKDGAAAVSGPHLSYTVTTGSLEDGGFSVAIDGQTPVDNTVTTNNLNFDVVVTADAADFFKGILFRVGSTTSDQVIPGNDLQVADACGGAVGSATHMNANEKTSGTATIDLDDSATLNLDITVVVQNDDGESVYYYMGYKVIVQSDASCRDGLLFRQCGGGK